MGKKLIGAKKGATISVDTPAGVIKYKILKVEKPAGSKTSKSTKKTEEKAPAKTAAKTTKAAAKEEKPAKKTTKKKADK